MRMDETRQAGGQRRQYSRILFQAEARVLADDREFDCEVRDLSLKGALLRTRAPELVPGRECLLELVLDADRRSVIRMAGRVAHVEGERVGLHCEEIDLDSITHLRRLLELNLGDADLLNREFAALIAD
jgi:hypothetical protein